MGLKGSWEDKIDGIDDVVAEDINNIAQAVIALEDIPTALAGKVDKVAGKDLSDENYSAEEKNKLAGIEGGAQKNTVNTVSGKTGDVELSKSDVGLNNVDNTSDMDKPVSNAVHDALLSKLESVKKRNAFEKKSEMTLTNAFANTFLKKFAFATVDSTITYPSNTNFDVLIKSKNCIYKDVFNPQNWVSSLEGTNIKNKYGFCLNEYIENGKTYTMSVAVHNRGVNFWSCYRFSKSNTEEPLKLNSVFLYPGDLTLKDIDTEKYTYYFTNNNKSFSPDKEVFMNDLKYIQLSEGEEVIPYYLGLGVQPTNVRIKSSKAITNYEVISEFDIFEFPQSGCYVLKVFLADSGEDITSNLRCWCDYYLDLSFEQERIERKLAEITAVTLES